jgi:hypothetical protein
VLATARANSSPPLEVLTPPLSEFPPWARSLLDALFFAPFSFSRLVFAAMILCWKFGPLQHGRSYSSNWKSGDYPIVNEGEKCSQLRIIASNLHSRKENYSQSFAGRMLLFNMDDFSRQVKIYG